MNLKHTFLRVHLLMGMHGWKFVCILYDFGCCMFLNRSLISFGFVTARFFFCSPEIGKKKVGQFGLSSGSESYSRCNCINDLIDKGWVVK